MPNQDKTNGAIPVAFNGVVKQKRHSIQTKTPELPSSNLRHTQSHRYDSEGKKKQKKASVLSHIESIISEGHQDENERKSPEKKPEHHVFTIESDRRSSKNSRKSEKINSAYDNAAYDSNLDKKSISSRAGSSRQPSLQSLEVLREQYCCCARRTKCEKKLLITVIVLALVIVVLVVVLGLVASNKKIEASMAF